MAVTPSATPVVFAFGDYREYLKAFYEARRETSAVFSYRFMAQRLDVDAGQLARILQGKLHLPQRALAACIQLCHLEGREAAFFEELVRLGRTKKPEDTARCQERLEALKVPLPRTVTDDQAEFYQQWHHAVVRSLAALETIPQTPEILAHCCRPPILASQARDSLHLLERLGLLERNAHGRLAPTDSHLVAHESIPVAVLRHWHSQAIDQSRKALAEIPPTERDVSTMTVALAASDLATVREWVADLRRQARALAANTQEPDRVFQINVQCFPVAQRAKTRRST